MVPRYNIHTPSSAAYTLAFCYGTFKNIVIPLRGMEKLRLWAIVTLLSYFNSASTTGGKYYSLLLGYLQKKLYILHNPPSILLPSSTIPVEKYNYSNYGHIKIMNHGATVAFLDYFNSSYTITLLAYFINLIAVLLQ
jgi:hypothetical protein